MELLNILIFNWRCWLNPEMGGVEVFTKTYNNGKYSVYWRAKKYSSDVNRSSLRLGSITCLIGKLDAE